jgi:surface polysaccharide O-acyltransferase-like enzyme
MQPINQKEPYPDHIRVLLTALVILHHALVTYGASGGWYYKEPTTIEGALIPMTFLVSTNQSFFMGFFFLLAAYFTESSLLRKGPATFLKDRFKRLGIPLIFYSFVLSPFLSFLVYRYAEEHEINYWQYLGGYDHWIEFGVLWFVAALLVFTVLFVILRKIQSGRMQLSKILLFAFILGLITFVVRLVFPVGWVLHPVGFQLGHFPQYITLFIMGIIARRNNWVVDYRTGKRFAWTAVFMIVVLFPAIFVLRSIWNSPLDNFLGGWHREAFIYSLWEQITGISIIVAFLGIAREKWNQPSKFMAQLSRESFAVYIFHPLPLIVLSMLVRTMRVDPAVKLLIVAPAAVIVAFLLGKLIVKIPGVNKII